MTLEEALNLSRTRTATTYFDIFNSPLQGRAFAVGDPKEAIFIGGPNANGDIMMRNMQRLASLSEAMQGVFLRWKKWEPQNPVHPLVALAREAPEDSEDGS